MSDDEYKRIKIEVCIPVVVELRVRWDEEEEVADIGAVAIAPIQMGYDPRGFAEHLSDSDHEYIDEATKKAFGIED